MTKPTRAEKYDEIASRWDGEEVCAVMAAILADYAPPSKERRAELEDRRQVIEHLFERADAAVEDNPNIEEYAEERRFFQDWLAEIDAELEWTDD